MAEDLLFQDEIKQAVLAAIDARQYILGPQCRALEAELARDTGTMHATLTSSATAAIWSTSVTGRASSGPSVIDAGSLRKPGATTRRSYEPAGRPSTTKRRSANSAKPDMKTENIAQKQKNCTRIGASSLCRKYFA